MASCGWLGQRGEGERGEGRGWVGEKSVESRFGVETREGKGRREGGKRR
jgi:hypothetical protein